MTQITIPAPCAKKWSEMTPVQPDCRHCADCNRQIIDFSRKSDGEIQEYLLQNKGKICGRFRMDQMERPLAQKPIEHNSWGLVASMVALLSAQPLSAHEPVAKDTIEQGASKTSISSNYQHTTTRDSVRTISGKVMDQYEEPLIGASVSLRGTSLGTVTDISGCFSLKVPLEFVQKKDVLQLVFRYTALEEKVIDLPKAIVEEDLALPVVTIEDSGILVGEIVVKTTPKAKIYNFFHRIFHR